MKNLTKSQLNALINLKAEMVEALLKSENQRGRKPSKLFTINAGYMSNRLVHCRP